MRHITHLRKIYNYYSCLGHDDSSDNTYIMNKMQFWRMLKDCKLHHLEKTLTEMDRWLGKLLSPLDKGIKMDRWLGKLLTPLDTGHMIFWSSI